MDINLYIYICMLILDKLYMNTNLYIYISIYIYIYIAYLVDNFTSCFIACFCVGNYRHDYQERRGDERKEGKERGMGEEGVREGGEERM
jgi:hypothetical protein